MSSRADGMDDGTVRRRTVHRAASMVITSMTPGKSISWKFNGQDDEKHCGVRQAVEPKSAVGLTVMPFRSVLNGRAFLRDSRT
jgi:hypothetical protein